MPRFIIVTLLLVASVVVPTTAQQPPAPGRGRGGGQPVQAIQMVKPGLYVVPGGGANSR